MNKTEFVETLRSHLIHFPLDEADEIVRDQEEYIREAIASGRREEDVVASLGDPKAFAGNLAIEARIDQARSSSSLKQTASHTFSAVFGVLALAPLNLIIVFGPVLMIVALIFSGWIVSGATLAAAVVCFFGFFIRFVFVDVGIWAHVSVFFFILGCASLSSFCLILMYRISDLFFIAILAYLKWNLKFIRGRS